jgi:transcriptional regulator with XRE-family HTH domain
MNNPKFSKEVGSKIKAAREKRNLTQAEVAKKAGINTNYYSVIERGEVNTTLDKLQKISKALGINVSDITSSK